MSLAPEGTPARAAQLANLRPVSRDRKLASEMGKKHGFGNPNGPRCAHVNDKTGKQCKRRPEYGTPVCRSHGARRYKGTPPSPFRHLDQARAYLKANPPPDDLRRHPVWVAAEIMRSHKAFYGLPRLVELRQAWALGEETGDWRQWHEAIKKWQE